MDSQKTFRQLNFYLLQRPQLVLWLAIAVFVVFCTAVSFWKYAHFLYNGIDLAYFSQIFWNMLDGRFFEQSIHPHLSLGDHAELIMPLLLPLYAVWPDPRMLLLIQAAALGLTAWPVYWLAERHFKRVENATWQRLGPLLLALAWLANPALAYIALFEFHVLALALPLLLMALLAYDRQRWVTFWIWAGLALLVREDVALVVAMVGALAWLEKRPWRWRIGPVVVAAGWFVAMMALISHFQPDGSYKFMIYYAWLGETPTAALAALVSDPLRVLAHLLSLANLEMMLGLLMPFLFVPLLAPAGLVLALLPLLQMVLAEPGGSQIIVNTHYSTLFLPAVAYAAIPGLARLPRFLRRILPLSVGESRHGAVVALVLGAGYSLLSIGPLLPALASAWPNPQLAESTRLAQAVVERVPPQASVAASYRLLPPLANRRELYSLHYQFLGVSQFAAAEYAIPAETRFMAVDTEDLLAYDQQFHFSRWAKPHYDGGYRRLRQPAGRLVYNAGHFQLYDRQQGDYRHPGVLSSSADIGPLQFRNNLVMTSGVARLIRDLETQEPVFEVSTSWAATPAPTEELIMRIQLIDQQGQAVWTGVYPFGNGLWSATELTRQPLASLIRIPVGRTVPPGSYRLIMFVKRQPGTAVLDRLASLSLKYEAWEVWGTAVFGEYEIKTATGGATAPGKTP
jgi:uncharacterized membrane protein